MEQTNSSEIIQVDRWKIFEEERTKWTTKIKELASGMVEIGKLGEVQVDIYSTRQVLVDHIHSLMSFVIKINNKIKVHRGALTNKYTNNGDLRTIPKESQALMEAELAPLTTRLEIEKTRVEFFKESLNTVDKMIFGIKYRIELENWRRPQ